MLGDIWSRQFANHSAPIKHQHAIAHLSEVLQLSAVEQDNAARLCLLDDYPVDFGLGADVDPSSRVIEKQDERIALEPLSKRQLLLVASGQAARGLAQVAPHNAQRIGASCRSTIKLGLAQPRAATTEHARGDRHHIGDDVLL